MDHRDRPTEKPLPDWEQLAFDFIETDCIFEAHADESGEWTAGGVQPFHELSLSPAASVLNYGQAVFEGLKAQRTATGRVVLFRPDDNARRFRRSAAKLAMPPYPAEDFVQAVEEVVRANLRWVPPYGLGSLYIRPVMIGSGPVLGVKRAPSYRFYIFVSPVGRYLQPKNPHAIGRLIVLDSTHRMAAYGTGDAKAAGNYAGTIRPHLVAAEQGYQDVLYLDARQDRFIEEIGSSNFFAILKDGTLVTPRTGSILAGITRDSVITIARELLGWRVVERDLDIADVLAQAREAFFTGTAAVLQPVHSIHYKGQDHPIRADEQESRMPQLYDRLVGIQTRLLPDPFGWVRDLAP